MSVSAGCNFSAAVETSFSKFLLWVKSGQEGMKVSVQSMRAPDVSTAPRDTGGTHPVFGSFLSFGFAFRQQSRPPTSTTDLREIRSGKRFGMNIERDYTR